MKNDTSKNSRWSGILPVNPEAGTEYRLVTDSKLKISLRDDIWAIFIDPYSPDDSSGSQSAIENFTLCGCQCMDESDNEDGTTAFTMKVVDVVPLKTALALPKPEETSVSLGLVEFAGFIESIPAEESSKFYRVANFELFTLISLYDPNFVPPGYREENGTTFIIGKKDGKSRIVYANRWDYINDYWLLLNEELTDGQERKYRIEHVTADSKPGRNPVWLLFQFGKMNLAYI